MCGGGAVDCPHSQWPSRPFTEPLEFPQSNLEIIVVHLQWIRTHSRTHAFHSHCCSTSFHFTDGKTDQFIFPLPRNYWVVRCRTWTQTFWLQCFSRYFILSMTIEENMLRVSAQVGWDSFTQGARVSECFPCTADVTGDSHVGYAPTAYSGDWLQKIARCMWSWACDLGPFSLPFEKVHWTTRCEDDASFWIYFYL